MFRQLQNFLANFDFLNLVCRIAVTRAGINRDFQNLAQRADGVVEKRRAIIFGETLNAAIAIGGGVTLGGLYMVNYAMRKGR